MSGDDGAGLVQDLNLEIEVRVESDVVDVEVDGSAAGGELEGILVGGGFDHPFVGNQASGGDIKAACGSEVRSVIVCPVIDRIVVGTCQKQKLVGVFKGK